MNCDKGTCYAGCACHEAAWAEKLAAAEDRAAWLRWALKDIAARPCEGSFEMCSGTTDVRALWCSECIARAALTPPPEAEKKGGEK